MTESCGHIYCFSNPDMPGLFKIGMTERTPEERLREANSQGTWRPPSPYVIEMSKWVNGVRAKERCLHRLLERYGERPNERREFFRVDLETVNLCFELLDEATTREVRDMSDCRKSGRLTRRRCSRCAATAGEYMWRGESLLCMPCIGLLSA